MVVLFRGFGFGRFIHSSSRSYYLFFTICPYYLSVYPFGYKDLARNLPVWYKFRRSESTRLVLENFPKWGSAQIGVEIQHKDRLLTDPGTIEDVRAVENDVVPFDRG